MRSLCVVVFIYLSMISPFVLAQDSDYVVIPSLEFKWMVPSLRENGDVLPLAEIGGYELRWKIKGSKSFRSVVIRGGSNKSHRLTGLVNGAYECEIAVFDADGLYSKFVPIKYKSIFTRKPIAQAIVPVLGDCNPALSCNLVRGDR